MQQRETFDDHVLGYQIEHIQQFDKIGIVSSRFYRVTIPVTGAILGEYAQRAPALRAIVAAELAIAQSAVA